MYLNCHSYFSFKYGILSPAKLIDEAKRSGISSLALTDINNTSGILDFTRRCIDQKIKPIAGIDFFEGSKRKFIGIAKNNEGFRELNDYLSQLTINKHEVLNPFPSENCFFIYPFQSTAFILKKNEFIGIRPSEINK